LWNITSRWLQREFDESDSKNQHDIGQYFATANAAPPFTGDMSVRGPFDGGRAAIILKYASPAPTA
jgi:hypothetical protein